MAVTDLDNMVVYLRTDDSDLFAMTSPTNIFGASATTTSLISVAFPAGFVFRFAGSSYSSVSVSVHGYARFAGSVASNANSNLFAANSSAIIAPWWDAMRTAPTGGYVQYEVQGAAPRRRLVIEWYCALNAQTSTTNKRWAKFQLILIEGCDLYLMRYGAQEIAGTPAAVNGASIGCKGPTTVIADNFRDFTVDNLMLGASKTTTTQNLNPASFWPTWGYVVQPAYPMDGRVRLLGPDRLAGLQDPYAQPLQDIANNANWHYCNHCPPLVNISPDLHSLSIPAGTQFLVVPVTPSGDSLSYTVFVGVYCTLAGTLSFRVDQDNAADPQPQVSGDWTALGSTSPAVSSGYNWLSSFTVTVPSTAQYLRFRTSNSVGDAGALSILVVPTALLEPPSATTAIDWTRVGIAQIAQEGGAQHPEFLNRCARNIALVMRDRRQMLWSAARADDSSYQMTFGDLRLMSVAPASFVGQRGATVAAVIYATDSGGNGEIIIRESGGSSVKFTVADNGGEYRMQTLPLTLISDQPLIEMNCKPNGTLKVCFAGLIWTPGD